MKSLDTRDLQERLDELTGFRDILTEAREQREHVGAQPGSAQDEIDEANQAVQDAEKDFGEDEAEELKALEELRDEIGSEWKHGVQLIPESDFEDHARELAEDVCPSHELREAMDNTWPFTCIDWERAARELKMDYSSTTFRGDEYLYRN